MDKNRLRKAALARRDAMDPAERAALDEKILERLTRLEAAVRARTVMSFVSFRSEVDTRRAIRQWLAEGRCVCVPRIDPASDVMRAVSIGDLDRDLAPGAYGILEPVDCEDRAVAPERIDLVLAPGLLFDSRGYRVGYGRGYFDRFLKQLKAETVTVGLAYDWQIVESLPTDSWDAPVNWIVTDSRCLQSQGRPTSSENVAGAS